MSYNSHFSRPYFFNNVGSHVDPLMDNPETGNKFWVDLGISSEEVAISMAYAGRFQQVFDKQKELLEEIETWGDSLTNTQSAYKQQVLDMTEDFDPTADFVVPTKPE